MVKRDALILSVILCIMLLFPGLIIYDGLSKQSSYLRETKFVTINKYLGNNCYMIENQNGKRTSLRDWTAEYPNVGEKWVIKWGNFFYYGELIFYRRVEGV